MKEIILSKSEQETLIGWTEDSHEAEIQTFSPPLKRKLAEFARKYPELCQLEHDGGEVGRGGVIYRVDRRRLRISFSEPRIMSEAQKEVLRKINAKKHAN